MKPESPCPKCGASWDAGEIPEKHLKHYGGATHYSRLIGVEDPAVYDGALYWQCPDCGQNFSRFGED